MEKNYNLDKNKIKWVEKDSIAEELGIEVGDRVLEINGRPIDDIIDYLYLLTDEYVEVTIEKKDGELWLLEIDKDYYEELGVEFENPIMDKAKSCSNNCIFCFVDQNPKGMRETLYFKDDDSRLSFLQGNFVTLTNLKQRDLERIVEYRISPLNVSIHTTNPEVRVKMLRNRFSGDVLDKLKYLVEEGIEVNGQIVLCPGYNDGQELDRTLNDLYTLSENLHSVAIVPVGITQFREGLETLSIFDQKSANKTIDQVHALQDKFLENNGSRFAFLSDEFYMIANRSLPAYDAYEGFIQLENGVGLMRKFEYELMDAIQSKEDLDIIPTTILTGSSAYNYMQTMVDRVVDKFGGDIEVIKIMNDFYGHTITVAGLITAGDIIKQTKDRQLKEQIVIPDVMLRTGEAVFLDNITLETLENTVKRPIRAVEVEGHEFLNSLGR